MSTAASGLAYSIHTRLIRHAKQIGADPNLVLTRFATERFLYRLSRSSFQPIFLSQPLLFSDLLTPKKIIADPKTMYNVTRLPTTLSTPNGGKQMEECLKPHFL